LSYIKWLRERVGSRKVFLVFSSVILKDKRGHILLQRRTDFGFWGLPGGVLELGEDISGCARRELLEETGLLAGVLRPCGIYTHPRYDVTYPNQDQVQQCTICFQGCVEGGEMRADGVEVSEQAFFAPEELLSTPMPIWYRDMIRNAQLADDIYFSAPYSNDHPLEQLDTIRPLVGHALFIAVGATVVVASQHDRILALRNKLDDCWRLPAGLSKLGENVAQTAVRRVKEETGQPVILERIVGIYSAPEFHQTLANGDQLKQVGPLFLARLATNDEPLCGNARIEVAWKRPAQLAATACDEAGVLLRRALPHWKEGYFVC
jgi:ADP-ribose pyrophosphatase YjhB (NUDIX family)